MKKGRKVLFAVCAIGLVVVIALIAFYSSVPKERAAMAYLAQGGRKEAKVAYKYKEVGGGPVEGVRAEYASATAPSPQLAPAGWSFLGQKVIRNGTVALEVKDAEAAQDEVVLLAVRFGGFVAGNAFSGSPKTGYKGTIVLRIPNERLDAAVRALRDMGKVTQVQISSENVTEEYVDLESRIATKRQEEAALLKIMERRGDLSDILAVERELARVRGEIEQAQGRLRYLADQVALSTLTVNITQKPPAPLPPAPQWKLAATAKAAWRATVKGLAGIARAGLWIGVTAVIWLPVAFILSLPIWLPGSLRRRKRSVTG